MPAVTGIEFHQFSAKHHNADRNWLVVQLNTDQPGLYGLGDASPMEADDAVKLLATHLVEKWVVDRDPLDTEAIWTDMYHNSPGKRGRLAMTAISGIDIALWDLKGKILDRPVYQLLGGSQREKIRVYANGWYANPGTPEQNAEESKIVVDMGYTAMKFDPFAQTNYYKISEREAAIAEARVAKVREAVGPEIDILVEAHAKFDVMNAIKLGNRLEKYHPLFYEEPVSEERVCELLEVRRKVAIPIATGERLYSKFPFADIIDNHAVDVLQPDIANAGGITELKKIAIMAEAKHITMAPHNVCSPIGAIAEMHLDASIVNFEIQEYHAEFYSPWYFTVCPGLPRQKDGYITLSDAPGLGIDLDLKEIAKHPPFKRPTARGGTNRRI